MNENGATSRKGYLAGGDATVAIDRRRVSWAIGMAWRAVLAIDRELQGLPPEKLEVAEEAIEYRLSDADFFEKQSRVKMPEVAVTERRRKFDEAELGLEADKAVEEAKRCLQCHSMCLIACPYDAPQFITRARTHMFKCNFCVDRLDEGKEPACVAACPVMALDSSPLEELVRKYSGSKMAKGFTDYPKTEPAVTFKTR